MTSTAVERSALSARERDEMHGLLDQHFAGVSRQQFDADLSEKNWVILLTRGNELVGFSTLLVYEARAAGEIVSVIYSGDTIVTPEAWGTAVLPRAWITAVNQLRRTVPRGKYYWLLLTSGFRTYRFLPVFWREFYPCFERATPPAQHRLLDYLARERFGEQYIPQQGIVRFAHPQQLRGALSSVPQGREIDPHIAFFLARNPGHVRGDELVCLTELSPENLTAAGRRMVRSK
jgi:hypothetical protein